MKSPVLLKQYGRALVLSPPLSDQSEDPPEQLSALQAFAPAPHDLNIYWRFSACATLIHSLQEWATVCHRMPPSRSLLNTVVAFVRVRHVTGSGAAVQKWECLLAIVKLMIYGLRIGTPELQKNLQVPVRSISVKEKATSSVFLWEKTYLVKRFFCRQMFCLSF